MYLFNLNPVSKPRMTISDRWTMSSGKNIRKPVANYLYFKDKLNYFAKGLNFKFSNVLIIEFYLPMPKSWSLKKKKVMDGTAHLEKPDLDNLIKGFMDALLIEDKTVYQIIATKLWSENGKIIVREKEEIIDILSRNYIK